MGKQNQRKIVVRVSGNDPEDRLKLLQQVEKAFRSNDIDITIAPSSGQSGTVSKGQLEIKVVKQRLQRHCKIRRKSQTTQTQNLKGYCTETPRHNGWLSKNIPMGIRILIKWLPVAKKIKDFIHQM